MASVTSVTHRLILALGLVVASMLVMTGCSTYEQTNPLTPSKNSEKPEGPPNAQLAQFYRQNVDWGECPDDILQMNAQESTGADVECGEVTVPIDYENPDNATMTVFVNRYRATGEDRLGSLVANPGGPGSPGTHFIMNALPMFETLQQHFDIVSFDPRGTGKSNPLNCMTPAQEDLFNSASFPDTSDGRAESFQEIRQLGERCQADNAQMLPFTDTWSTARDLDIIRAALGDDKLTYIGFSYGTYLGQMYADTFPDKTGRLVLDGVVASDVTYDELSYQQAVGFDQSIRHWAKECLSSKECPFQAGSPDKLVDDVIAFLEGLLDKPLPTNSDNRELTQSLATTGIIGPLYSEYSYSNLTKALDSAMNHGDGTGLLELADYYNDRRPDGTYESNSTSAFMAINFLDYAPTGSEKDWEKRAEKIKKDAPFLGDSMGYGEAVFDHWPVKAKHPRKPLKAKGAPPIVLIGNLHDPATPYSMAESTHKLMESSVLITVDSWSHTAYGGPNSCVNDAVEQYLIKGVAPSQDIDCH